ncbi:MAG: pilus assembly PilX N-terminal domain-containing protein [Candidatus Gracilibacteria bacterium]|jgi:hypothetical protein
MKKVIRKIRSKVESRAGSKSGSALLVAILVMGVLMVLTLGMSDLVIREIRQTKDLVASGKAYFSAEAGIENALLDLHENAPGYQTNGKDGTPGKVDFKADPKSNPDFHYSYQILNQADSIPSFDPDQLVWLSPDGKIVSPNSAGAMPTSPNNLPAAATYNALPLNGSIVIPLSRPEIDANGHVTMKNVEDFMIEYYFPWRDQNNSVLNADPGIIDRLDVLRWKIFGYSQTGDMADSKSTDSISDFYPALKDNSPDNPVCIGTNKEIVDQPNDKTICQYPILTDPVTGDWKPWSGARQCYLSDSNNQNFQGKVKNNTLDEKIAVQNAKDGGCTISEFVQNHTQNYLVLTNVVNPAVLAFDQQEIAAGVANIYYRVIAKKGEGLVRESASIKADGFALNDQYLQSIDVNIGLSSFLPVFNFSLYGTDSSKNAASAPSGQSFAPANVKLNADVLKKAGGLQANPNLNS